MTRKKVIIDCDPGIDDSIAIVLACKSRELDVLGITTVAGNCTIEVTTKNALKVLEMLNLDIPVAQGMARSIIRNTPRDPFSHGSDGQADNFLPEPKTEISDLNAVDFIVKSVTENPQEITLICLGPLTNIAISMLKNPEIKNYIHEIIALSGAFGITEYAYTKATGDTPQSEWNVYVDPEAAEIVYGSGVKFTAIGLDIAAHFKVDFTDEQIKQLQNSLNPEAGFLHTAIQFVRNRGYEAYCTAIDSLAVAYAINPRLIEVFKGRVGIETDGKYTFGNTVLERRDHHAWEHMSEIIIGKSVDYEGFLSLLIDTVLS